MANTLSHLTSDDLGAMFGIEMDAPAGDKYGWGC